MRFKNLCIMAENQEIGEWLKNEEKELEDYFDFVLNLTDRKDIKDRMLQMKNELVCYVIDSKRTQIPRTLEGNNRSLTLPDRAVAFVREQNVVHKDEEPPFYDIKCGLAYLKNDTNRGVKFHELNHNLSRQLKMTIEDGGIFKSGTVVSALDLDKDKFIAKTKNFVDECFTDAIAKYYYETHYNCENKERYGSEYRNKGMTLFGELLLGKDLSDKDALNAYFGDTVDLLKFETKFYQNTGVDFRKILKQDYSYSQSIDGENMSMDSLLKLAIKYRLNSAENEQQRNEEVKFLLSIDFDNELSLEFTSDERLNLQKFLIDECEKPFQEEKKREI